MNALDYAKDLIAFDSVSSKSNLPVADYVADQLDNLGFHVERIGYDDENGVPKMNIIGKRGEGTGGFGYFAHNDVVPVDDWSHDSGPFDPTVSNDRLYGRGACDMKGSLACMLAAAAQWKDRPLSQPLYVVCTADEEIGYGGADNVVARSEYYREMVDANTRGIIGEPTKLKVVYAHKGTFGFIATARGRAAHSSTNEGVNANVAMIPFLSEMKRIYDETRNDPVWLNDEFTPPNITWNIGINDHTHAINITAPQSVCTVYFRPMPGQDGHLLLERARKAADDCGIEFFVRHTNQPLYTDPKSAFVGEVLQLTENSQPYTVPYGTDGSKFHQLKQLVVLGPGDIAQAHTSDEFIELEQLSAGTETYQRLIGAWCAET